MASSENRVLVQDYASGQLSLMDLPIPTAIEGTLVIQTLSSVVSIGTESAMIRVARKSLLGKALERPDWVRQVTDKIKTEGVAEAYRQSKARLETPVPLGYSSCGRVVEVGRGIKRFHVGDEVVCTGSGYASHAQFICIPEERCEEKPPTVQSEHAAFSAMGGIALEAIRLASPQIGHRVAVIGLGLLGLLTVKLLRLHGCQIIGMDPSKDRVRLGRAHGCEAGIELGRDDLRGATRQFTQGLGCDSAIVMAATPDNDPLQVAAEVCGQKAKVVVAGQVGMTVPRDLFFAKELELVVSRAWGQGSIDGTGFTERLTHAQPRWSASANIQTFLDLLAHGQLDLDDMITRREDFDQALTIYENLLKGKSRELGVVLTYKRDLDRDLKAGATRRLDNKKTEIAKNAGVPHGSGRVALGVVGAGSYAKGTLLPVIKKNRYLDLIGIASNRGLSASNIANKFGFRFSTTKYIELIEDPSIDLLAVLTRHGSHARIAVEALLRGKHVFVEKPLALSMEELNEVIDALIQSKDRILMVGYNRRFSPYSKWLQPHFSPDGDPITVTCHVNAGTVPLDSWIYDPVEGGGRIIGELCHFIDLIQFFTGSIVRKVYAGGLTVGGHHMTDNVSVILHMENGSMGLISYVSGGDKRAPRERVEVVGQGAVGVIDNFRSATIIKGGKKKTFNAYRGVDRGHKNLIDSLLKQINGEVHQPERFEEYINTSATTFGVEESIKRQEPVSIIMP